MSIIQDALQYQYTGLPSVISPRQYEGASDVLSHLALVASPLTVRFRTRDHERIPVRLQAGDSPFNHFHDAGLLSGKNWYDRRFFPPDVNLIALHMKPTLPQSLSQPLNFDEAGQYCTHLYKT